MSRRARQYQAAQDAKRNPDAWDAPDWRSERDEAEDELPAREEDAPVHTLN